MTLPTTVSADGIIELEWKVNKSAFVASAITGVVVYIGSSNIKTGRINAILLFLILSNFYYK